MDDPQVPLAEPTASGFRVLARIPTEQAAS
jgi:hypothetical protein